MIIDTMVMAYALLAVPKFGRESAALLEVVDEITAPASVEAELLNVVWQWGRKGISTERASAAYYTASRLWTKLIPVEIIWPVALDLALSSGHSPYDTLFIAAARLEKTRVVTYDKKLLNLFPDDAVSVHQLI